MTSRPPVLFSAAAQVQQALDRAGLRFCIIGGVAVQRWGEQRFTRDVDFTVLCPFGEEDPVSREIARVLISRVDDATEFARRNRVFLGMTSDGTPVDVSLGGIDYEVRMVDRATPFQFAPDANLITCSAEDLVVLKAFAGRPNDWRDLEGIILRWGPRLDWTLVETELKPLLALKEPAHGLQELLAMRDRLGSGQSG